MIWSLERGLTYRPPDFRRLVMHSHAPSLSAHIVNENVTTSLAHDKPTNKQNFQYDNSSMEETPDIQDATLSKN